MQFAEDTSWTNSFQECWQFNRQIIWQKGDCQYFVCWSVHIRCMQITLAVDWRAQRCTLEYFIKKMMQKFDCCPSSQVTRIFLSFVNKTKCFCPPVVVWVLIRLKFQVTFHLMPFYEISMFFVINAQNDSENIMNLKMSSAKLWLFCLNLNMLHMQSLPTICDNQMARLMGPTWGPPGSCRPQMGPMLAPWTLLSG